MAACGVHVCVCFSFEPLVLTLQTFRNLTLCTSAGSSSWPWGRKMGEKENNYYNITINAIFYNVCVGVCGCVVCMCVCVCKNKITQIVEQVYVMYA